ncbi:MAG: FHA domain-containing protein [Planctomycetes bacterium]|nr:FHA domain-containing protein [Planctomycetota bacterium]
MQLSLVVVSGGSIGAVFDLEGQGPHWIGSQGCNLPLSDPGIAARHARFELGPEGWVLTDVGGEGFWVNGVQKRHALIQIGDQLRIGAARVNVVTHRALERPPACVRAIAGPTAGQVFPVGRGLSLGRATTADVPLLDARCSRVHCRIESRDRDYVILDLGSTNGSWVNQTRLVPGRAHALERHDRIQVGATVLEFDLIEGAEPSTDRTEAAPMNHEVWRRGTAKVEPEEVGSASLQGDLSRMAFAELVQFLHTSGKSGHLVIHHTSGTFAVFFDRGNVIDAASPFHDQPLGAFCAMARLGCGAFAFHDTAPSETVTIRCPTPALLIEAMRLVDEATEVGRLL